MPTAETQQEAQRGAAALDPGSDVYSVAGLVKRRSLMQRLVRPVAVVMPRVLGHDLAQMLLAEKHLIETLSYDPGMAYEERLAARVRDCLRQVARVGMNHG
jgi:hypothetical protein